MTTHDELAYAVALDAVAAIRAGTDPWPSLFRAECHVTSSRQWPVPDFVLSDRITDKAGVAAAAEFKPPGQTKREYLTGLGQALAYTRDFDYAILVVPQISDDSYEISQHIQSVLAQPDFAAAPLVLLEYDPRTITPQQSNAQVVRFCPPRTQRPAKKVSLEGSFYAKWREMSAEEVACFLRHLYREHSEPTSSAGNTRDRAWAGLWKDIQAGKLRNWSGDVRRFADTPTSREANKKNWRNFLNHIGWMETDGTLTESGLAALHTALTYGGRSMIFVRSLAQAVLLEGKHLILINAINEYQRSLYARDRQFPAEPEWLAGIEQHLENKGLLQRNPERHGAAIRGEARGFLKAEKQLWKELGFIVPNGRYAFHHNQGFVFDWARITELVRS